MSLQFRFLLILGILFSTIVYTQAQQREVQLVKLLEGFREKGEMSISFDANLLSEVYVDRQYSESSWDEVQKLVASELPFEVLDLGEGQFVIRSKPSIFNLQLSSDEERVLDSDLYVLTFINGVSLQSELDGNELSFEYQPAALDTLQIQVIGYELIELPARKLLNDLQLSITLSPLEVKLAGFVVEDFITKGININPSNQQVSISTSQLPLLPGETDGDIFSSLAAIPGLSTPDNRAGNIYIRGSSTDQTLIMYEDIPIYHRGHYFGTISPYNPQVIDHVNVSRSGFDASLGGRVGGTIEINTVSPSEEDSKIGVSTNTLFGSGFIKIPSKSVGLSVGARRSYPVTFQSPKLAAISEAIFDASAINYDTISLEDFSVIFEDYQLGFHSFGDRYNLDITGIYTTSTITFPGPTGGEEENLTKNGGLNIKWNQELNLSASNLMSFTVSDYYFGFNKRIERNQTMPNPPPDGPRGPGPPPDNPPGMRPPIQGGNQLVRSEFSVNQIFDVKWSDELTLQLNSRDEMSLGLDLQYQTVRMNYQNFPLNAQPDTTGPPEPYRINELSAAFTSAGFVNYKLNRFKKLYSQLGIRAEHYSPTNQLLVSPRLFASYDVAPSVTLKSSAGRYYQYLSQIQVLEYAEAGFTNLLWQLADGEEISIIKGDMIMVGALFSKGRWVLDVESYLKWISDVNYFSTIRLTPRAQRNSDSFFYQANQSFKGVDVSLKRQVSDHMSIWLGYSFIETILDVTNGEFGPVPTEGLTTKFSQPHVLYAGQSYEYKNLRISAGWRYASGLSTLSPEYRLSRGFTRESLNNLPDRFSPVHWLDLSASYKIPKTEKRSFQSTFGLSLVNVYNRSNVTDEVQRVDENTVNLLPEDQVIILEERNAIGFAPNLNITIEW